MATLIWVVVGISVGVGIRVLVPRGGVGGVVGDMAVALVGAGLGAHMVDTVAMAHHLGAYLLWIAAFSGAMATGMLATLRALSNHGTIDEAS